MPPIGYALLTVVIANLCIGSYVFLNNPKGTQNRAFAIFSIGIFTWSAGFLLLMTTHIFFFDKVTLYGGLLLLNGFLYLAEVFPRQIEFSNARWLMYVPGAIMAILIPTGLVITQTSISSSGAVSPVAGPLMIPYALVLCWCLIVGITLSIRRYRASRGIELLQLRYFLGGLILFISISVVCSAILPALGLTSANFVGPLASIIFVGTTAYAIVRHELMDIRVVIQRGVVYTIILALITALYVSLVHILGLLLGHVASQAYFLSAGITTMVGIYGAPVIETYFRHTTRHIFFKDPYDYALVLGSLSEILHRNSDLATMISEVRAVFDDTFHPESINILPTGRVVLGAKRSGDAYTTEDNRLLETFSHLAGTAFDRGRLFDRVKRHTTELEMKVNERTAELRSAKENQKQMMIEISHNLQTPLTVMRMRLQSLRKIAPHDDGITLFEQSLTALSTFIYDLMTLARLEHTSEPSTGLKCNLSTLVTEIAEEIDTIATSRGIRVRTHIHPAIYIQCDAGQIRQALMNIASNALKYMKVEGTKEIHFSASRVDGYAQIAIQDTGIGIAAEDMNRVFEQFYRVSIPGRSVEGSGLGLPIAKRIVELNGGTTGLESSFGSGTTVTMTFQAMA